jgi:3-deoxy-D-manno-octulosonate 8-phosphate phosphatase (KDO 8-P phosphatase)
MSAFRIFENNGGRFLVSESSFISKLDAVKAFVFDWDGVFTNAEKDHEAQSYFTEVDSMGSNLLRFSFFLKNKELPLAAIISGENNKASFVFSERENYHANYFKVAQKAAACEHFCHQYAILPSEICYVFDDVLDLSIAQQCGLRIFIPRKANPLLNEYVIKNKLADYITFSSSGNYPVRETCELLIATYGSYDEIIQHRINYSEHYAAYISRRREIKTKFFTLNEGKIAETKPQNP